jgi:hypothetical protein
MGISSKITQGMDEVEPTLSIEDPAGCLRAAIHHLEDGSTMPRLLAEKIAAGLCQLEASLAPFQEPGFFRFLTFYNTVHRPSVAEAVEAYNQSRPPSFPMFTTERARRALHALVVAQDHGRAA